MSTVLPRFEFNVCDRTATVLLRKVASLWFAVIALGHWIFCFYIAGVFGPSIASSGVAGLAATHLPRGYIPGDTVGNWASAAHVLVAMIVVGGGPVLLIPRVRVKLPSVHRWLGRVYVTTAVLGALTGTYMVWTRGSVGGKIGHVAITVDALLILWFAAQSVRHAVGRRLDTHRRWALRLFLASSAVWFFRVGLMAWVAITGGVGVDFKSFTGAFLVVWGFGDYLLPLLLLEVYFRVKDRKVRREQLAFACLLGGLTLVVSLGVLVATTQMWLPRLR